MIEPTSSLRWLVAFQATKDGPVKFATSAGRVLVFADPIRAGLVADGMVVSGAFQATPVATTAEQIAEALHAD